GLVAWGRRRGRTSRLRTTGLSMTQRDWLILLLGLRGRRGAAMDPVRVQKGMFLFAQEAGVPASEQYRFEPFHYGPYSFELRRDLDDLVKEGVVGTRPVPGYSWARYALTRAGAERARDLISAAPRPALATLYAIKQRITSRSFNALLREVYREYPG